MAIHVTRCPHCQTSFRVHSEHLGAAKGMVRCGSCLQVFKAADYFTDGTAETARPSAPANVVPLTQKTQAKTKTKTKIPVQPSAKPSTLDDDLGLIHDDMDHDPISETLVDNPSVDFNLRAPDHRSRPKPRVEFKFDDAILNLDEAGKFSFSDNNPAADESSSQDEKWASALLETENKPKPAAKTEHLTSPNTFKAPAREADDFEGFADHFDEDTPDEIILSLDLGNLVSGKPLNLGGAVANLKNDPLELQQRKQRKLPALPWGWLMGSVLLLGIAASQVLYFTFDQMARNPQWQSSYAALCRVVGCQLPQLQNTQSMSAQHLRVRPHPTLKGALLVELLLINKADYEQPFPDLLLVFRDLNNRTLASRLFNPALYLAGELAGQKNMPVHTPVHLALEIVDPGANAVSYNLSLLANQP